MNGLFIAARVLFGLLFVAASVDKIVHPEAFATIIYNYRLLPDALVSPAAIVLPWLELTCGLCLAAGRLALGAAATLCGLMAVFMAALAFNWHRGLDVACGCFTVTAAKTDPAMALLRDAGIMALGIVALAGAARRKPSDDSQP